MKEKHDAALEKTNPVRLSEDDLAGAGGGTGPEPAADPVRDPVSPVPGHVMEPVVDQPGRIGAGAMDRLALGVDRVREGLTKLMTGSDRN